MLESGCELVKTIEVIEENSSKHTADILESVKRSILKGKNLTEAFRLSNVFSDFFVNMVKAGENSGNIVYIFEELSKYYDREDRIRNKVRNALIYPVMLSIVSFICLVFILIFVVPNFESAFKMGEMSIPKGTRMIFATSKFLRKNLIYVGLFAGVVVVSAIHFVREDPRVKSYLDRLVFRLPKIKTVNALIISERFSRGIAILLGSGIRVQEAMEISSGILENTYARERIRLSRNYIETGYGVKSALEMCDIFPRIFLMMLETGEEGGDFVENLGYVASYFQEELDRELENMVKLIEPMLILVMGVVIAFVLLGILSPIYDLIGSIS